MVVCHPRTICVKLYLGQLCLLRGLFKGFLFDYYGNQNFASKSLWNLKEGHPRFNFVKVIKGAKIRNRYNKVPHLTQDTNGKVTNSQFVKSDKIPAGNNLFTDVS